MNEIDEYAVEEALKIKEAQGGEVTVLCMGPDAASETVRKALSMGADKAVHVARRRAARLRRGATSLALAKAIEHAGSRPSTWCCSAPSPPTRACASCRRCSPSASAARS